MPFFLVQQLLSLLLVLLIMPLPTAALNEPSLMPSDMAMQVWECDGDPLSVRTTPGAVDLRGLTTEVPNIEAGTAPGDGVLITWRGETLQLPRTNNAGTPSYTDGRWWWRAEDPATPEWKERRGSIISYACRPLDPAP